MNRRLLIFLTTLVIVAAGTYAAIQFGKGYRPDFTTRAIRGTGLLVANSIPKGAQVHIDGKLTTATDDTINLPPGEYDIEIKKDGYLPWKKRLRIEAELVTQANARLFPAVTDLDPLTFMGAANLVPSPDSQKIVYTVTRSSLTTNNGLWILDLIERPLSLSKDPRQIALSSEDVDWSSAILSWSPDSNELLAHLPATAPRSLERNIRLSADDLNRPGALLDVTARLPLIFSQWEEQLARKLNDQLLDLPLAMQDIATASATNLYFSPDGEKLLYTATREATIPEGLIPPPPATSTQQEERRIRAGNIYVYDRKEDKNFLILGAARPAELSDLPVREAILDRVMPRSLFAQEASPSAFARLQKESTEETIAAFQAQYSPLGLQPIIWFSDSSHLIHIEEERISILDYDGTNRTAVYAGPFEEGFVYPWPDGSKILILTNLNPDSSLPPNIYAVNLK